jgi:hypothetical protein
MVLSIFVLILFITSLYFKIKMVNVENMDINENNLLVVKKIFLKYIEILKTMENYEEFVMECEKIQIIESTQGALTVDNVIQICCNDIGEINEIIYVLLHELTHVYLKSSEHDELFDSHLDIFLSIAITHNLYDRIDYTKHRRTFCGKIL